MDWAHSGSNLKSLAEIKRLVDDEWKHLDNLDDAEASRPFLDADGWREETVEIPLPKEQTQFDSEEQCPHFKVSGIYLRNLLQIIKTTCEDPEAKSHN
ncbi:uncharacterized protein LAESUDRAFT_754690 [Laetiporus sulphureus 93-53]|uniref:Uncharacterized protein n=1 Tax=Laetiporus sulphureus 93-53 TaxID=1314785 RepID=A0A165HUC1_9APHY|nr:uncharacterized protein LAESUDRAFT_754690 [Laetiporus sulphureus 93-53]KZT12197.1 hypothetical protein LAESUDRAFT_754690 [Laetiporus sulphureus 93-53]